MAPSPALSGRHTSLGLVIVLASAWCAAGFLSPAPRSHLQYRRPGFGRVAVAMSNEGGRDDMMPPVMTPSGGQEWWEALSRVVSRALTGAALAISIGISPASSLPARPPESNAQAILIQALPQQGGPLVQEMGAALARITTEGSGNIRSVDTKGTKGIKPWADVVKSQRIVSALLNTKSGELLQGIAPEDQAEAKAALQSLQENVDLLGKAAEVQDRDEAIKTQITSLRALDRIGTLKQVTKFPFEVTGDYPSLPKLLGRAEVQFTLSSKKTGQTGNVVAVLDGFSAPLTAGNFADLVQKRFYDKSTIGAVDESTILFGDPAGPAEGYEEKGQLRTVPLEILAEGDKEPTYGETLEEQSRYKDKPKLPFSAWGTMALAHPSQDPNGGSSQVFFLRFDPVYTPAGLNTLDGNYAVFGYVVEGGQFLDDLLAGDVIEKVEILNGQKFLKK